MGDFSSRGDFAISPHCHNLRKGSVRAASPVPPLQLSSLGSFSGWLLARSSRAQHLANKWRGCRGYPLILISFQQHTPIYTSIQSDKGEKELNTYSSHHQDTNACVLLALGAFCRCRWNGSTSRRGGFIQPFLELIKLPFGLGILVVILSIVIIFFKGTRRLGSTARCQVLFNGVLGTVSSLESFKSWKLSYHISIISEYQLLCPIVHCQHIIPMQYLFFWDQQFQSV